MLVVTYSWAQGDRPSSLNADSLFNLTLGAIKNDNYDSAKYQLEILIEAYPEHYDGRVQKSRIFAWEGQYDIARDGLDSVLLEDPDNIDAYATIVDVEIWSKRYGSALAYVESALEVAEGSMDLAYKKALILTRLERYQEAKDLMTTKLGSNHSDSFERLRTEILTALQRNEITLQPGVDVFSEIFDPAVRTSLSYKRSGNWGAGIFRLNYANRFESTGFQMEVDAYPKINSTLTAFVNYGYSTSFLFPEHRFGLELTSSFLETFEFGGGMRYLKFPGNEVFIYTGSVAKYLGDYRASVRVFVTPEEDVTGLTVVGDVRRYFSAADNYVGLLLSSGFSPDMRLIQTADGFSQGQIYNLESQMLEVTGQKSLKYRWLGALRLGITRQELLFDLGSHVVIFSGTFSVTYRF